MAYFGAAMFPDFRQETLGGGFHTELATVLGPGSRVCAYVRSSGPADGMPSDLSNRLVRTMNDGLKQARSGMGDIVLVAHDHAENVSSADFMSQLKAGTRILGQGYGRLRPTLTWTAAGSTFLFDVANVIMSGFKLEMAGPGGGTAFAVAAPITVSASGCAITDCQITTSIDADNLATIPITTTAAADHFTFARNRMTGATAGECTTMLRLVGADYARILSNTFVGATSAVNIGVVQFITTASTEILLLDNFLQNNKAASTAALTGLAGVTGFCDRLYLQALGSHTDFEVIGDANGLFAVAATSLAFGPDVYGSGDLAQRMAPLTPLNA